MFDGLTDAAKQVLPAARRLVQTLNHSYLGSIHLFLALLESQHGQAATVLKRVGLDFKSCLKDIQSRPLGFGLGHSPGSLPMTPAVKGILQAGLELGRDLSHKHVGTEHLLLALLDTDQGLPLEILNTHEVDLDNLRDALVGPMTEGSLDRAVRETANGPSMTPALDTYTSKVPEAKAEGAAPVIRPEPLERLLVALTRSDGVQPLLLGDPGVGKSWMIPMLAQRLSQPGLPESLRDLQLRIVDLGLLIEGTASRGSLESRFLALVKEASENRSVLVFDGLHDLVSRAAGQRVEDLDLVTLMKPRLESGELRMIALASTGRYLNSLEQRPELDRWFQRIHVPPSTREQTLAILNHRLKAQQRRARTPQAFVEQAALAALIERGHALFPGRQQPAKALELLEQVLQDEQRHAIKASVKAHARVVTPDQVVKTLARLTASEAHAIKQPRPVQSQRQVSAFERQRARRFFEPMAEAMTWTITRGELLLVSNNAQSAPMRYLRKVVEQLGLSLREPDGERFEQCLRRSEWLVFDLTESAGDPSLLYQLGLCHAAGRCPLIIAHSADRLPKMLRRGSPIYLTDYSNLVDFENSLKACLEEFLAATRWPGEV